MFRGQFLHSIDSKGRLSLPARFRDAVVVDERSILVVTPAPVDPCLHAYPLREWERLEDKISEYSNWDPKAVRFRRMYVSAAIECEVDKHGRLVVPQHLRERIGLEKEVQLAGMGKIFEMWSKPRWDEATAMSDEQREAFMKDVMETIRI